MNVIGVDDRLTEAPFVDRIYPPEELHAALARATSSCCSCRT